jgi:hypothetical protein
MPMETGKNYEKPKELDELHFKTLEGRRSFPPVSRSEIGNYGTKNLRIDGEIQRHNLSFCVHERDNNHFTTERS